MASRLLHIIPSPSRRHSLTAAAPATRLRAIVQALATAGAGLHGLQPRSGRRLGESPNVRCEPLAARPRRISATGGPGHDLEPVTPSIITRYGAARSSEVSRRRPVVPEGQSSDSSCEYDAINHLTGAQKRTRTSTAVKPLAPEASASTNSAIWAPSAAPCGVSIGKARTSKGGSGRGQQGFSAFARFLPRTTFEAWPQERGDGDLTPAKPVF